MTTSFFFNSKEEREKTPQLILYITYFHKCMTVNGISILGDLLKTFYDVPEILAHENLLLVRQDESDGHTHQDLVTLIEQAIPDP